MKEVFAWLATNNGVLTPFLVVFLTLYMVYWWMKAVAYRSLSIEQVGAARSEIDDLKTRLATAIAERDASRTAIAQLSTTIAQVRADVSDLKAELSKASPEVLPDWALLREADMP
jgi:septal ring factor EnvC (AmiA/AmiB activator)